MKDDQAYLKRTIQLKKDATDAYNTRQADAPNLITAIAVVRPSPLHDAAKATTSLARTDKPAQALARRNHICSQSMENGCT